MTDEERVDVERPEEDAEEGEERTEARQGRSSPLSEIQDFVEDVFENVRAFGPGVPGRHPRIEMAESTDDWFVQLDLPGVEKDSVEVTTVGDELRVSGRRGRPAYPDGTVVRRSERAYGSFRRTLRLPAEVDAARIGARLEAGVLELRMPKRGGEAGRKVEID
jgi:HSP20 family molecular chaperone IbpA